MLVPATHVICSAKKTLYKTACIVFKSYLISAKAVTIRCCCSAKAAQRCYNNWAPTNVLTRCGDIGPTAAPYFGITDIGSLLSLCTLALCCPDGTHCCSRARAAPSTGFSTDIILSRLSNVLATPKSWTALTFEPAPQVCAIAHSSYALNYC